MQGTNIDLLGKVNLLGAKHELLIGFDAYKAETNSPQHFSAAPAMDIYNPVYGQVDFDALATNGYFYRKQSWSGLYVQDQMTFFDRLHILIGGRYDRARTGESFSGTSMADARDSRQELTDKKFSPRVGALYQISNTLSVYGSYTESFGVNNGLTTTGSTFKPEIAKQYEVGFKTESADKTLVSTVSLFDLTRDNLLTDDRSNPDPLFRTLAGEARSTGIEADVSGQITNKLKLLATFAHMDARYTKNNDGLEGKRLENAARNQGSLWGTYQFDNAFKAGLGVVAVGSRMGDPENTYELPGYERVDAMASYRQRIGQHRVTLQLNVYNLFDKDYYANSGGSRSSIMPGLPRSFLASLKYEF